MIGIVPDIQQNFRRPLQRDPLIYLPFAADPQRDIFIVARTGVPPAPLASAFRREVQSLDENLPVYDVRTLEDRIAMSRLETGSWTIMFTIFAAIALMLAAVGLYAVIAHSVSRRTREIGVRMAVGGTAGDIVRLVLAECMRRIAIGLAVGLPLAFAATRALRAAAGRGLAQRSNHISGSRFGSCARGRARLRDPGASGGTLRSGSGAAH